jgi:hypothetical protein
MVGIVLHISLTEFFIDWTNVKPVLVVQTAEMLRRVDAPLIYIVDEFSIFAYSDFFKLTFFK